MKKSVITALVAILLPLVFSGCTRSGNSCDDCYRAKEYRDLWDRSECRHRHSNLNMPEEFFDARDFRHDSIYGDHHGWRDGDCGRYYDGAWRHFERGRCWSLRNSRHRHYRHGCLRRHGYEDAESERYIPHPAPDLEYDE